MDQINCIDSAFQSLNCDCGITHLKKGVFDGEGFWVLYQNGQITMKGSYHQKKLVCGIVCTYDKNGLLNQIKLFKDGKYVGDAPIPQE